MLVLHYVVLVKDIRNEVKMPFKSKAQRSFLYANYPKIAKNWAKKHGTTIQKKTGKLIQKKRRSK